MIVSRTKTGEWVLLNELKEIVQSFNTREEAIEALKTASPKEKTEGCKHGNRRYHFEWVDETIMNDRRGRPTHQHMDIGFVCMDCHVFTVERRMAHGLLAHTEGEEIVYTNYLGEVAEQMPEKYWSYKTHRGDIAGQ